MEPAIENTLKDINRYNPVPWDMIPDLGLYMDQVITFITRMYEPLYGDASNGYLSAAMINNYVKNKLIPRPVGKKYNREQIALLSMIVALKQVSTMEDIRIMITPKEGMTVEQLYTLFCRQLQTVIAAMAKVQNTGDNDLPPSMNFAIAATGYRIGCEAMLRIEAPEKNEHTK